MFEAGRENLPSFSVSSAYGQRSQQQQKQVELIGMGMGAFFLGLAAAPLVLCSAFVPPAGEWTNGSNYCMARRYHRSRCGHRCAVYKPCLFRFYQGAKPDPDLLLV